MIDTSEYTVMELVKRLRRRRALTGNTADKQAMYAAADMLEAMLRERDELWRETTREANPSWR